MIVIATKSERVRHVTRYTIDWPHDHELEGNRAQDRTKFRVLVRPLGWDGEL